MLISGTTGIDLTGLPINNSGNTEVEGNLNLSGVGKRITGDFSNATASNRVAFQTSAIDGNTIVTAKPNGAGTQGMFLCESTSDANNCQTMNIHASTMDTKIVSAARGTSAYVPMLFVTGGAERMRIDTSGNVGIGTTAQGAKLQVVGSTTVGGYNNVSAIFGAGVTSELYLGSFTGNTPYIGSGGSNPVLLCTNGTEKARVTATGDLLLTSGTGGIGYGAGAGGTVTQLTSKSTAVTLNKPSGKITMNNAALAAGANVTFTLNNSLLNSNDTIHITFDGFSTGAEVYIIRHTVINGAAYINIINNTATSRSDAMVLNFVIIKGATA